MTATTSTSFTPQTHAYLGADGTELSYAAWGAASAPTIVLCHGLAANGNQFVADARHFAASGYRVLVPDLRGHGHSHKPDEQTSQSYAIATMARDMIAMLDDAKAPSVHWVGNSLGGIVALAMVQSHAGRFMSLSLFGTCFALSLPLAVQPVFPLLHKTLGPNILASVAAVTTTRYKPARPLIAQMAKAFDPQVGAAITAHVRRYDLTANALAFQGPLLVMVGGRDLAVNLSLRPALKRMGPKPNWTIVDLPEGGHCSNLDATQLWRETLQSFWASRVTNSPERPGPAMASLH